MKTVLNNDFSKVEQYPKCNDEYHHYPERNTIWQLFLNELQWNNGELYSKNLAASCTGIVQLDCVFYCSDHMMKNIVEPETGVKMLDNTDEPEAGVKMLNNIVENHEQCER